VVTSRDLLLCHILVLSIGFALTLPIAPTLPNVRLFVRVLFYNNAPFSALLAFYVMPCHVMSCCLYTYVPSNGASDVCMYVCLQLAVFGILS